MKLIREFDDFDWVKDSVINPWLEYDGIIFDLEPRRDEVNEYIEMALKTRDDIANKDAWRIGRESDITAIIDYQKELNKSILSLDKENSLSYGSDDSYFGKGNLIRYSQLIGMEPLTESEDPLQWIRDIQPPSFKDAVIGQTYNITTTPVLLDAIRACGDNEEIYSSKRAEVRDKDNPPYSAIFCDHEREDEVLALFLEFLDEDGLDISQFWVTEDMIQLY